MIIMMMMMMMMMMMVIILRNLFSDIANIDYSKNQKPVNFLKKYHMQIYLFDETYVSILINLSFHSHIAKQRSLALEKTAAF